MNIITNEMLEKFKKSWEENPQLKVLQSAASKTKLSEIAFCPKEAAKLEGPFSLEIETHGVSNQKKSGRCWMFATVNIMREAVIKKCNLKSFLLSNNYLAFFDKLEKCNSFLEGVIANIDHPMTDRENEHVFHGQWDGGLFGMAVDLVKKYGIVPDYIMPETFQSCNTTDLMAVLNRKLRKDGLELRKIASEGGDVLARKEEMLAELYRALCIAFGEPVDEFDFEYRDADNVYHVDRHLTPKSFYEKYIGLDLEQYITVSNEETSRKPLYATYSSRSLGDMAESTFKFLNLPMEEVKELIITQMKDGEPVWFANDSDQFSDRPSGIWDQNSMDFGGILGGLDLNMTKEERLATQESSLDHAMILVGVNFDENGKPNRWKIQNSWGDDIGKKGYFVCSDAYMNEFVYQAVINKKYLNEKQLAAYNTDPIVLKPWER